MTEPMMQNGEWIELFRSIPLDQHGKLVIVTNNGVELSIEQLVRTEAGHLIFRGRVCGQSDDGRLFFLPYDQITYLNINRFVKEDEIKDLLGGDSAGDPEQRIQELLQSHELAAPVHTEPSPTIVTSLIGTGISHPTPNPIGRPPSLVMPPTVINHAPPKMPAPTPPPPAPMPVADAGGNKNTSILERLRAQRNSQKGAPRST